MNTNGESINPHGGNELVDLRVPAGERSRLRAYAETLSTITLNARDLADLEMLASGAFTPLTGYMAEADYVRSRDDMRLASNLPWPIPNNAGSSGSRREGAALRSGSCSGR
jgi:sulfate adenylyltransferase